MTAQAWAYRVATIFDRPIALPRVQGSERQIPNDVQEKERERSKEQHGRSPRKKRATVAPRFTPSGERIG